ncbi:GntR family transcriptional regulator [Bordetella petrii]|uniref:GntR family transcriptional regulator n=1 Tax=Bordetella petrii TaxID=94624 RepID=UPI001E5A9950|nr:GntR family transcriptional regulator [Bordetella petrii]MCD0502728.1 GntR family transcriptional regulator [Bordetella petrii]
MLTLHKTALTAEEEAYQHIHQQIRLGGYAPGARLVPEVIAGQIGTSRMPVRGALRRLASEGLVEIRANRGAVVRGLNAAEMREVFEMRSVLEGLAMRNAVAHMRPEHIRRLEHMLDQMDLGSGDYLDWTTAHREFHEYLCGFCQQPRLLGQIADLHSVVEPYMRVWSSQARRTVRAREAHQELIDALKTGDAGTCEHAMRQHVMNTVAALEGSLLPAAQ